MPPQESSSAKTALTLGLLSPFCCGVITGIPAIVMGVTGLKEINASGGQIGGHSKAVAGIVLGTIGLVLTIIGGVVQWQGRTPGQSMRQTRAEREAARMDAEWKSKNAAYEESRRREKEAAQKAIDAREKQEQAEIDARKKRAEERAAMTADQRMAELKETCMPKVCDAPESRLIVAAAKDDRERNALQATFDRNLRSTQIASREDYASGLDQGLLKLHLSPQAVEARGVDKTTLYIKGWFCTRQGVYDLTNGNVGKDARMIGFKKLECEGIETWTHQF